MFCTLCSHQTPDTIHSFQMVDMKFIVPSWSMALSGPLWYVTYLTNSER